MLPVEPVPVEPVPVEPVPVERMEPVWPQYEPPRPARKAPASGVWRIILAGLSLLMAAAAALAVTSYFVAAPAKAQRALAAAANAPAPAPPVPLEPELHPGGLAPAEQMKAVAALATLEALNPARREQLELLFARAGLAIFPNALEQKTTEDFANAVQQSGEMFSARPGTEGPHFFVTAGGRIEVFDERAVFRPDDGSATVRTFAGGPASAAGLSPEQVSAILAQVQAATRNAMNHNQTAALAAVLSSPSQVLVPSHRIKSAVRAASVAGGQITIDFIGGPLTLNAQGEVVGQNASARPAPSALAFAGILLCVVAFAVMAVWLLLRGVQSIRHSTSARRPLLTYARVQIPLALLTAALAWWMVRDFNVQLKKAVARPAALPRLSVSPHPHPRSSHQRSSAFIGG